MSVTCDRKMGSLHMRRLLYPAQPLHSIRAKSRLGGENHMASLTRNEYKDHNESAQAARMELEIAKAIVQTRNYLYKAL